MASLIWLIVWLVQGTPNLEWFGAWNDWAAEYCAADPKRLKAEAPGAIRSNALVVFSGREAAGAGRSRKRARPVA